jgi:hypothetical protein
MDMSDSIATSFEFEPQPDGSVVIEFFDDDGNTINFQVMSRNAFQKIPLAAFVTTTTMELGPEVAKKLILMLRAAEEAEDESDASNSC